ncbi:MAG TPA: hypothetical protein VJQ57_09565 [Acidimicrobiia bacterium]|nr:hypothetical protein [Acidimicrobiia bacterium]
MAGELTNFGPDDEEVENRAPNVIGVAIEDTAEAAAYMPTIRAKPLKLTKQAQQQASKTERICAGYVERAGGELWNIRSIMDCVQYGLMAGWAAWDSELEMPVIEHRDARTVYPEPDWRPGSNLKRAMIARKVRLSQLDSDVQARVEEAAGSKSQTLHQKLNEEVTLVEYHDCHESLVAILYYTGPSSSTQQSGNYIPVLLERIPNELGVCQVVVEQRITPDGEPRGQFDQVIRPLLAYQRLQGMALDYADQAVYSDLYVIDPIGPIPEGGGGVIQLGPNGKIGRVPPAVSSLSLFQELAQLMDAIHLGGRWPKSRPGEIAQSQASAKFLESSVGMMNTAIKTLHLIFKRFGEKLLRICLTMDHKLSKPGARTMAGVLRNQQFLEEYNPTVDIDPRVKVDLVYGLGLGREPAQSAVLHIQYHQLGAISLRTVMESIEGLTDIERELRQLDVEKFETMALSKLMQGVESGALPDEALVAIAKARQNGKSLIDVFEEFVVKPQQEAAATQVQSGLGQGLLPPGPAPGAPGAGGMPVPPPPAAPDLIAQLSSPAGGPGNFIGSRATSG